MEHRNQADAPELAELAPAPPIPPQAQEYLGAQAELMTHYVEALCSTGVSHGLLGPREVPRMWERHILNCAVVSDGLPNAALVADVGSGAGLPGLVLAIARPDISMTLIEPLLRRTTWLENVIDELVLDNVRVIRARADEQWGKGRYDVVTSRAVARIGELARWSLPLVREGGEMFALKGSSARQELDEDADVLRRLRVKEATVEEWGEGFVGQPTVTVRLRVDGLAPQLTRKQAGTVAKAKQSPRLTGPKDRKP